MIDIAAPIALLHPCRIAFGIGTAGDVGRWAAESGYAKTLIVADTFNASRLDLLSFKGDVAVFSDVAAEPEMDDLLKLLEVARGTAFDLIVGYGGGSAMDLAKLAAALTDTEDDVLNYVGANKITTVRRVALAQVPTTAGTGSEVGIRALVTDPETSAKLAIESMQMLADFVAVDPSLTYTVPPNVTAATGIDALAHCVEAYTNRKAHPLIDIYAEKGIQLVAEFLDRAVRDGEDAEARAGLSLAALYGGFCLGPVNTAGGHAVSYPLGTRWKIAHGAANALIFPHVLAFNAPSVPDKTENIMKAIAGRRTSDAQFVFNDAHAFCANLGLKMRMSDFDVDKASLPTMAHEAFQIRRLLDNNPREFSEQDILDIYESCM